MRYNTNQMNIELDTQDMFSALKGFYKQVKIGWNLTENIKVSDIDLIVITGMGGSALPGEILKSYLYKKFKLPIIVNKNYDLPEYINQKTLLIVSSFSGNTEETIESMRQGNRKGCKIIAMSHAGKLEELAKKLNKTFIKLPSALQPRLAYGYSFFAILRILQNSGLITNQEKDVNELTEKLNKDIYKKKAFELSQKLKGKIPLIYSSERLYSVAYKWKINFNENAKIHAFCDFLPELNHNEMVGYTKLNGDYYVLIIKDEYDLPGIKKRMKITKELIHLKKCPVLDLELSGSSDLVKIFSIIYLGDWTSYFLALENGIDPTPVDIIENFKKKL
jgi:glucose/mannose-6-phosphate isomerase